MPLALAAVLGAGASAVAEGPSDQSSVSASPSPVYAGETLTLTATVSGGSNPGPIQFSESPYALETPASDMGCQRQPVTELGNGDYQATCTGSFGQSGSETVQANGTGSGGVTVNAQPLTLTVEKVPTTVAVTASSTTLASGETVLYKATITYHGTNSQFMTGTTEFYNDGKPIPGCQAVTATESSAGSPATATCGTKYSADGTYSVTAAYSGNDAFAASTSQPLSVSVGLRSRGQLGTCAGQDTLVSRLSLPRVRASLLCLLNEVLARYDETPLTDSSQLDGWAQAHPAGGLPAGFQKLHSANLFSAGGTTPYELVAAELRNLESCEVVLGGMSEIGIGLDSGPVFFRAKPELSRPVFVLTPSWTLLLAATSSEPVGSNPCPVTLPVDTAGKGPPPPRPSLNTAAAWFAGNRLEVSVLCSGGHGCKGTIQPKLAGRTLAIRHIALSFKGVPRGDLPITHIYFTLASATRARVKRTRTSVVQIAIDQTRPAAVSFVYEVRLGRP